MNQIDENDNAHLAIVNIQAMMNDLKRDHDFKMMTLNDTYAKIFNILVENDINPRILNNMSHKFVTGDHLLYDICEKNWHFFIHLHLHDPKIGVHITFVLKNIKTDVIIEETITVYKSGTKLSNKFILFFRNSLSSYYNS